MGKLFDLDDYQATSVELKKYIDNLIVNSINEVVVQEDTYLKFPTIGSENIIYIDTTENNTYRWDDKNLKYYIVGSDWRNIKIIDGSWE